jgi:hypothetical protein
MASFRGLPHTISFEAVSQFVIPAKSRETGREPGSRSPRYDAHFLDSISRFAAHRSFGMTGLRYYDTASSLVVDDLEADNECV